jgi:O-antigen/teichoic acid export membrane protein
VNQRIGREAVLVAVGQVATAVGLLAAVRFLSNALSPVEYGVFILGLTAAALVSQTLLGPLANAAQRFYVAAQEAGQLPEFWATLRILGVTGAALVLVLGIAGATAIGLLVDQSLGLLAITCAAFAILSGWETLFDSVQSAERRRGVVAWHQGLRQWLRPILALLFISVGGAVATAAIAGYAVASCLVLISQANLSRELAHSFKVDWHSPYAARVVDYAAPFATWGLFTWAHVASDRWALGLAAGPETVAAYAVTFQLGAQPLYLLGSAAAQFVEPIVYATAGLGVDAQRVRAAFQLNMRLASVGAAVLVILVLTEFLAHPLIFAVLAAPQYQPVAHLLPLAAISGGLFSLGQLVALGSVIFGSSRVLIAPKIVTSVVGITLNIGGAYLFGIEGVLVAGIVTALLYCIWTLLLSVSLLSAHK